MRTSLLAVALVVAPAAALAHTTPAVLGPAGPAEDPLAVIRIAHGLAVRADDGGYRYVCPSAWGGPERPAAAGGYVFGVVATYGFGDDGSLTERSDLVDVLQADASTAGVFAVVRGDTSFVYRVEDGAPVYTHPAKLDGLTADATSVLVAAAEADGGLTLVTIATTGSTTARTVPADLGGAFVTPIRTPSATYVRARDAARTRIGRVEAARVAWIRTSTAALFGPQEGAEGLLVVEDGALVAVDEDGESVVDDTRRYTCLDRGFVCTLRAMYRVDDRRTPVFELDALGPPDVTTVEDEIGCRAQWIDLSTEAGLSGDIAPAPEPDVVEPGGCACESGRGGWLWLALLPLIVFWKKELQS